jgi:NhaP-type Na+/H+ or K+/H+ antiporter
MDSVIGAIIIIVLVVLVMRFLGAWMLRINEIIDLLKEIKVLLKSETEIEKKARCEPVPICPIK